jgi:chromosome segregation ATPase
MTDKELRAARRDLEAEHDRIEEELASLQAEHERLVAKAAPIEAAIRANEAKRDALTANIHAMRLEHAEKLKPEAA